MNTELLNRLAEKNNINTENPAMTEAEMAERITELEAALDLLLRGAVDENAEA